MNEKGKFALLKVICILGALSTTIWCFYEYLKNEDMCEVYFKRFTEDQERSVPLPIICSFSAST